MEKKKYALITGATSGIGLETAKGLIEKGFFVIGTSRNDEKESAAKKYLGENSAFIRAELTSQESIKELAKKACEMLNGEGLNVLINNAGTFYSYYSLSEDGVEKQFAVNTIAPLLLSLEMFGSLKKAKGRIVTVSSSSHYNSIVKWNDMQLSRSYGQLRAYKQTKLLSVMTAKKFNEISQEVKIFMSDPGLVNTEIGYKNSNGIASVVWKHRKNKGQPAAKGAETSVYLATAKHLPDELYFKDCKPQRPSRAVEKKINTDRAWDYCQKVIGYNAKEVIDSYE